MNRLEATRRLVKHLKDDIVVGNLGNACNDLAAAAPGRPQNCYTRGGMGMVSSMGLGLAVAQPGRKVVVLDGDGSLLMNLGSLATIAAMAPKNLIHVVWDNEQYQLTGGQTTHTGRGTDLAGMARAAGYKQVAVPRDEDEFEKIIVEALDSDGPTFVWAKVAPAKAFGKFSWDPVVLKIDFMRGIGTLE
jgi:thiamine pyrophosphate-dependent acetolactate synthase large subunit-like protein